EHDSSGSPGEGRAQERTQDGAARGGAEESQNVPPRQRAGSGTIVIVIHGSSFSRVTRRAPARCEPRARAANQRHAAFRPHGTQCELPILHPPRAEIAPERAGGRDRGVREVGIVLASATASRGGPARRLPVGSPSLHGPSGSRRDRPLAAPGALGAGARLRGDRLRTAGDCIPELARRSACPGGGDGRTGPSAALPPPPPV